MNKVEKALHLCFTDRGFTLVEFIPRRIRITYSFADGTTIPPGETLKILSGLKAVVSSSTLVWKKSNM